MPREISTRLLRSPDAAPRTKPFELLDTRLKGFGLRVQPSGKRSFFVRWGRNQRRTLGPVEFFTPAEARERAGRMLGNVFHGRDPDHGLRSSTEIVTLGQYADGRYLAWAEWHYADVAATLKRLKSCFGQWYSLNLDQITVLMIEQWIANRRHSGKAASTINRDLNALSAALSRAVKWGLLTTNPVCAVDKCKVDTATKARFLTSSEHCRLLEALRKRDNKVRLRRLSANEWREARGRKPYPSIGRYSDHLTPMVVLSLHTGCRRGEILSLRWQDVDLTNAVITVAGTNTKNRRTRYIRLNKEAMMALTEWRKSSCRQLVFPGRNGNKMCRVDSSFGCVLREAKIEDFTWHDLRHTFASNLAMNSTDLNTIRELMGHSDILMTLRYAHLSPDHMSEAVERLCA